MSSPSSANAPPSSTSNKAAPSPSLPATNNNLAVKLPPNFLDFPLEEQAKFFIANVCNPLFERDKRLPKSQRLWTLNYISFLLGYDGQHGHRDITAVLEGRAQNIESRVRALERGLLQQHLIDDDNLLTSATVTRTTSTSSPKGVPLPPSIPKTSVRVDLVTEAPLSSASPGFVIQLLGADYISANVSKQAKMLVDFCDKALNLDVSQISRYLNYAGNNGTRDVGRVLNGTASCIEIRVESLERALFRQGRVVVVTNEMINFYGTVDRILEKLKWVQAATQYQVIDRFIGKTIKGDKHFVGGEIHVYVRLTNRDSGLLAKIVVDVGLARGLTPTCRLIQRNFAPFSPGDLHVSHPALSPDYTFDMSKTEVAPLASFDNLIATIATIVSPVADRDLLLPGMAWFAKLETEYNEKFDFEVVETLMKCGITNESRFAALDASDLHEMKFPIGTRIALQAIIRKMSNSTEHAET